MHLRDDLKYILVFLGSLELDFDGEIWLNMALMVAFGMLITNIMLN